MLLFTNSGVVPVEVASLTPGQGLVAITCPDTAMPVPTGIVIDAATYDRSEFMDNHVSCRLCGGVHRWSKSDAQLMTRPQYKDQ